MKNLVAPIEEDEDKGGHESPKFKQKKSEPERLKLVEKKVSGTQIMPFFPQGDLRRNVHDDMLKNAVEPNP